jgi:hypothetical protein
VCDVRRRTGEAEYVVTVFQYMRLLGYPAKKISIITSYRGQKCLIRDIINARCANNPLFGKPAKVKSAPTLTVPHRPFHPPRFYPQQLPPVRRTRVSVALV